MSIWTCFELSWTFIRIEAVESLTCDILVIGAGPAGSSAAGEASSRGARVIVVDRRAEIGVPVQCAEYIPAFLLGELCLGTGFVAQPLRGMKTFLTGRQIQEIAAPGYTIHRDSFDRLLADKAAKAGSSVLLSTRAVSMDDRGVLVRGKGRSESWIRAGVIIGADGPHSITGRWLGSENTNLIPAVQVRVRLNHPMEFTEIYFDDRIYGGYGWLFPKGDEANVGLGMKKRGDRNEIGCMLRELLSLLAGQEKIVGDPFHITSGHIPAEPRRPITGKGIMLAGDAAGHTHPITGAGIAQAVIGGRMAGKWAARAVESGDLKNLSGYESEWLELFGDTLEQAFERRRLLEAKWDRLEEIFKHCWVTFKEYHEPIGRNIGRGQRDFLE
jgi:geranylgeranyl reductase family protein